MVFQNIEIELEKLKKNGCEKILIFPMYPQYSATTTASVSDNVNRYLGKKDGNQQYGLSHPITMIKNT